jgi:excinuclease UvrABC nuclease subunit
VSPRAGVAPFAWRVLPIGRRPPRAGGVYAFFIDGALAYIGQSANLEARLRHYQARHDYGDGFFSKWGSHKHLVIKIKIGRRFGEWAMREQRLIRRLSPPLNQRLG